MHSPVPNRAWTNLITFYDKETHLVIASHAADIVCLNFSKAFDTMLHRLLLEKSTLYGLMVCTVGGELDDRLHQEGGSK